MIKPLLILVIITSTIGYCRCQESGNDFKGTAFYAELIGHTLTYSFNAEHHLKKLRNLNLGIRAGFGGIPTEYGGSLGLTGFTGKNKSHFDMGIALSYIYGAQYYQYSGSNQVRSSTLFIVPTIGYRYQKPASSFFLKAGITPLIKLHDFKEEFSDSIFWKILPSAALSFGYFFSKR
jgi:hypothetical protein